jgi:NAD-dependent dihydropyrimidine dehydrogenase PreA subunit
METNKSARKILQIDEEKCNGCGQCVPACAEGAIQVVDGKARLISERYCDGLGACLGECPQGAIRIIAREADEFDPEAVEKHLLDKEMQKEDSAIRMSAGCPSGREQTFTASSGGNSSETSHGRIPSALSHWPVQIRLVPPTAPFLKGADLFIAADCTPIAYPGFHNDFLKGRVVMIGCPKFDDVHMYIQKLADIFKIANIRSVTVLVMEVPCCQGLLMIIDKALESAGKNIPVEEITISPTGKIIKGGNR